MEPATAPVRLRRLDARGWHTPLTAAADASVGDARLVHETWPTGDYRMYGAGGFDRFHLPEPTAMRALQERTDRGWQTWMVDSPLEWFGLGDLARRCQGTTITAGLGMGLALHHLAAVPDVDRIVVVERSADIAELMQPLLPAESDIEIHVASLEHHLIERYRDGAQVDSILVDISVGDPHDPLVRWPLEQIRALAHTFFPDADLAFFGADAWFRMRDAHLRDIRRAEAAGRGYCPRCDAVVDGVRGPWRVEVPEPTWLCADHPAEALVFTTAFDRPRTNQET